jgi:hypothetical protein
MTGALPLPHLYDFMTCAGTVVPSQVCSQTKRKALICLVMSFCPSPSQSVRTCRRGCSWNLIFETFKEICRETPNLVKIGPKYRALYTKIQALLYCWQQNDIFCSSTRVQRDPFAAFPGNNNYRKALQCHIIYIVYLICPFHLRNLDSKFSGSSLVLRYSGTLELSQKLVYVSWTVILYRSE